MSDAKPTNRLAFSTRTVHAGQHPDPTTGAVMVPIYGKLNDIFGRKPILITGIVIFVSGSALCGLSGEFGSLPLLGGGMTQLIVFRGLQGIGGGALFTSAFAIIGDLFPPRERAKYAGLFGGVFGLASILGPVVGGFFTDLGMTHLGSLQIAGWRWIFYLNIPVAAVSLFMITLKMPTLTHRAPGRIDFVGAALIVVTFVPLLLALSWGGRDHPWGSPLIVGLLVLSAVGLVAFAWVESVVDNPILATSLFRNRVFSTANAANFVTSMAFMGSVAFLPLYLQLGEGLKATASGLAMVPMMVGMIASSTVCGQIINKTGQSLTHFYASTTNADSWEEDILGKDTLDDGETFEADIDDGSGKCVFDFKAVFESGQFLVKKGINVCQISTFTYNK